jgi:hypothetical protein
MPSVTCRGSPAVPDPAAVADDSPDAQDGKLYNHPQAEDYPGADTCLLTA